MIKTILTIMLFGLMFNYGCTDSSTDTSTTFDTSKGIVPLKVGNTWIRFSTSFSKSRKDTTTGYDTIRVVRDTLISGTKWYIWSINGEQIVTNQIGGFYYYSVEIGPYLSLKYPAVINDTIMVQGLASLRVSNIDTIITVPAGTFHCYRYDLDIKPNKDFIGGQKLVNYVSPNNGYIKSESYFSSDTSATLHLGSKSETTIIILK